MHKTKTLLREDRKKDFRKKIYDRYNGECCFTPSLVPIWASKRHYLNEELNVKCTNKDDLMIYRKNGNMNNNEDTNILLLCKHHYGIMFHELRDMPKRINNQKQGIRKETKVKTIITLSEFKQILSNVTIPQHLMLLQTLYYLGGRVTEVVLLEKNDVHLARDNPYVTFKAENTKRKVERHVTIPKNMIEPFKAYFKLIENKQRLFDFTKQRAWQIVKIYVKKAGIKKNIHPHSFRHSYATEIYNTTKDLKMVQELLGHKNMATTSIYAHVSDETKKEALDKVFGS